ncbi:WD40-repeat-containing domain protein [Phycomyces nitens]|nr:WD40-repeat-containing domain protein [Phycomyces nitens]
MKKKTKEPRLVIGQILPTLPGTYPVPAEATPPDPDLPPPIQNGIWAMKFSRDGCYLATGGQSTVVLVWRILGLNPSELKQPGVDKKETMAVFQDTPAREYRGHTSDILDLSWSTTKFLLSSSMDKTVRLWHVSRQECLCIFPHPDFVTSVKFHPKDDRFFATGSLDSRLRIWSIPQKKVTFWNETPSGNMITAIGFTPNGRMVCAGSHIGQCFVYETDGLRYNTQFSIKESKKHPKKGHKITGIEALPASTSGDEMLLITSNDSKARLYNMRDKSMTYKYKGSENSSMQIRASFSDDGRYIVCGSEDCGVYVWETSQSSFSPFHHLHSPDAHEPVTRIGAWLKRNERLVQDKFRHRPDHFEAHDNPTTVAIFSPTRTRQILARTGLDFIFNRTPIGQTVEIADGYIVDDDNDSAFTTNTSQLGLPVEREPALQPSGPSLSSTNHKGPVDKPHMHQSTESDARAEEEAYAWEMRQNAEVARENYTYPDGHIIISADSTGEVKVWRIDCGYEEGTKHAQDNTFSHTLTRHHSSDNIQQPVVVESKRRQSAEATSPSKNILHFKSILHTK